MIRNISVGIDIGSTTTRVVVGEFIKGEKNPKIVGVGESATRGVRHGYIVNPELAAVSLKSALGMAEKVSGIKIKRAFIAINGVTLRSETSLGFAIISKADGEVTNLDTNKALQDCEDNLNLNNKKIIHVFPTSFRLDGKEVLGRLEGMRGTKLEIKALFITCSAQHLEDLLTVITLAGVESIDVIASPVASSHIVLSEKQKIVGVALVDIGSEKVSIAIFENGLLAYLYTFSIGSSDITNDIALGFKIPLEKAEGLKLGGIESNFSPPKTDQHKAEKKKLDEIIEARLSDIFELVENHLKKIKRAELLPAGIIFIGGGANILGLEEFSKSALKLPSKIGATDIFGNTTKTKLRDPSWFTALGLIISNQDNENYARSSFISFFKDLKNTVKSSLKQLMP